MYFGQTSPPTVPKEGKPCVRRENLSATALVKSGEYFLCEHSHRASGYEAISVWSEPLSPLAFNASAAGEHRGIFVPASVI